MISFRQGIVFLLTLGVVLGMAAPGGAVALQQSDDGAPSNIPDAQVFEVSEDGQINAWERAAYPLRTDDTDAATQIPQPATVQGERLGEGSFTDENDGVDSKSLVTEFGNERNPMGVHDTGDVTISFDADRATAGTYDQLNGQDNVEVVAARLTPVDGREVPMSSADAFELFSDIDNANRNASFEILNDDTAIDSAGSLTETASFSPGHYVVFAAVHEDGREGMQTVETGAAVEDGNISIDGDVTIIGMDQLSVQEGAAEIDSPDDPEPGDNLTFEVDTTDAFDESEDGSVTHAVAVYNRTTFEDARFDLVVDESELGNDFELSESAQLEHSISETNGIARVEPGTTINGNDLTDGRVSRPVGASSVLDFIADEAGTNDPNTHPITAGGASYTETETLNASMTAINGADRETEISVDTFGNFSEGEYRYVVVSTLDDNESQVSTTTGTLQLQAEAADDDEDEDDDGGGNDNPGGGNGNDNPGGGNGGNNPGAGGGGGGSGGGGGPGDTPAPVQPIFVTPTPQTGGPASVTLPSVANGQTIVINMDDENGEMAGPLTQLNITSTEDAENVQVGLNASAAPSGNTPANANAAATVGYHYIDIQNLSAVDSTPGTFTFEVSAEQRARLGVPAEELQMYRYHNNTWDTINTTYLGDGEYQADTPGFSWFAIGSQSQPVSVTGATINESTVQSGEVATVTATVENTADNDANISLNLTADGTTLEQRTVAVNASSTTTVTFTTALTEAGTYQVAVGGTDAGTLTVEAEPPTATPFGTGTGPSTPEGTTFLGGGIQIVIVAFIVLAIAGLVALLRYEREMSQ